MKIFIWGWVDYKEFSFSTFMLILDASFKWACINFASIKVKERNSNACTLLLRPSIQEKLEWKEERRFKTFYYCCGSVTKSCPTLCSPMNCSTPGFPVLNYLPQFAQTHVHWVSDAVQPLILCYPLLRLPSIFPSIRVFFDKLALHIMWPSYWSYSFNISPSNEYSGLISFRIAWFDLFAVQRILKSLP